PPRTLVAPPRWSRSQASTEARRAAAPSGLGRPAEGRRERALAAVAELHLEGLDARRGRPGDRQRRIRWMKDTDKLRWLGESLRHVVLDVDRDVAPDLEVVFVAVVVEFDRVLLDAEHLADQRRKGCHRAAHLPREDARQLVRLLLGGLIVDEQADPPVAIEHLGRRVGDHCDRVVAHVGAVDLATLNVIGEDDLAAILRRGRRKARHRAGAGKVAVAVLEVGSLDCPAHGHTSEFVPERTHEAYYDPAVSPAPRGPMKMPRPSEDAKAAFARVVPDEPAITIKPMFGQMSAFVNGNMFCGIFGEDFFVRLPEEEIAKVKKSGGRDF